MEGAAEHRLLTDVSEQLPVAPEGLVLRRSDHGAFRGVEPGSDDVVLIRPGWDGLVLERLGVRELVPWAAITGITLSRTPAGHARVPTARVHLRRGPTLDVADALAPGRDALPFAIEPGGASLLRVERFQLLVATVISGAGLAPVDAGKFRAAPRELPLPPLAVRPRVLPGWAPPALLIASVFALVWFLDVSLALAVGLTLVLLLHEYGHALAMRACGMRVRGILILPFVGGGTLPEHAFASRWDEVRVALAGPLTAVPVALAAWAAGAAGLLERELALQLAFWTLGLNLLNLVPMLPLDGGRVLSAVAAGLPARMRGVVTFAPITLLAVVLVARFPRALGFAAALVLAFSLVMTQLVVRRHEFHAWMLEAGVDLRGVRHALRDITFAFTGTAREDVDGGVAPTVLSPAQSVGAMLAYGLLVAGLGAAAVFLVPHIPPLLS